MVVFALVPPVLAWPWRRKFRPCHPPLDARLFAVVGVIRWFRYGTILADFVIERTTEVSTMSVTIADEPIPLEPGNDGVIRIAGTRVTLDTVVTAFHQGATPEEIVQQYDSLNLADVVAVIS